MENCGHGGTGGGLGASSAATASSVYCDMKHIGGFGYADTVVGSLVRRGLLLIVEGPDQMMN